MSNETSTSLAIRPEDSLALQKVSSGLFESGLFPNAKNKMGAFAIIEYGYELGIPPMMALKNINIISGQLACNAQLMLSLATARGVTYQVLEESDSGAKIAFHRGQNSYDAEFNKTDAQAAGLLGKDNWKKYPRDMYFWRAVAKGVRRIAPDAVMGLYTADEISEGKFIDVVDVPVEPKTTDTPPEPDPSPNTQATLALITVKEVRKITGTNKTTKKPWTKYVIKDEEGGEYGTFSETDAQFAKDSIGSGVPVKVVYTSTKFGSDLVSISLPEPEPDEIEGEVMEDANA